MQGQPSPQGSFSKRVSSILLKIDPTEWAKALRECALSPGCGVGKISWNDTGEHSLVGSISELTWSRDNKLGESAIDEHDCIIAMTEGSPRQIAHRIAGFFQPKLAKERRLAILVLSLNESNAWFGMTVTKASRNPLEGYIISSPNGGGDFRVTRNRRGDNQGINEKILDCGVAIFGINYSLALPLAQCLAGSNVKHLRLVDNRLITKEMLQKMESLSPLARGRGRAEQIAKTLIDGKRDALISYMPESVWEVIQHNHDIGTNSLLVSCDGQIGDRLAVNELAMKDYLIPHIDLRVSGKKRMGEEVITADVRLLLPGSTCDNCRKQMMTGDFTTAAVSATSMSLGKLNRISPDYLTLAKERIHQAAVSIALQFWYDLIDGKIHESRWTRLEIIAGEEHMRKLEMVDQKKPSSCDRCTFTAA